MANPEHVPELDGFDRLTVMIYRSGIAVGAVGLALLAGQPWAPELPAWIPRAVVLAATALVVANMHLYDKRIRWVIGVAAWTGATLAFLGAATQGTVAHWLAHAGLGFLFVSLSAIAIKEQFCFRIPLLRAVPVLLAISLIPQLMQATWATTAFLAPAALIYAAMAAAKSRMPLHFDVGNKAAYQV